MAYFRSWIAVWRIVPALVLAATLAVSAQPSPFDGTWVADVPSPGGDRVRFVLELRAEDGELTGTLQIGSTRPVAIENGRIRGDVISFDHTLDGNDGGTVQFLARVLADGLHVGFMRRPADAPPGTAGSDVVNFTAKRPDPRRER
jgi:hypothetical protein